MMIAVWLVGLLFVPSNSIKLETNIEVDNYLHNNIDENVASVFPHGKFFEGLIIGTYWCGSGNAATYDGELGPNFKVDACCYRHDRCKQFIESGRTKYGLTNSRSYTSVSCNCDKNFYECLRNVDSDSSKAVIYLYSLTNPLCFIVTNEYTLVCASASPEPQCTRYRVIDQGENTKWENSLFRNLEPPVTAKPTILVENHSTNVTKTDEDQVRMPYFPNYPLPLHHLNYQLPPQYPNNPLPPQYSNYQFPPQYSNNPLPPQYSNYPLPPHHPNNPLSPQQTYYRPPPQNSLCYTDVMVNHKK